MTVSSCQNILSYLYSTSMSVLLVSTFTALHFANVHSGKEITEGSPFYKQQNSPVTLKRLLLPSYF